MVVVRVVLSVVVRVRVKVIIVKLSEGGGYGRCSASRVLLSV